MIRIHALGRFQVEIDDSPLRFGRKTPHKVLQLLQCLICDRGRGLGRHALCELLWPGEELWTAGGTLGVTLYRLRRLLCFPNAVLSVHGRIMLDPAVCWVDAWQFEQAVDSPRVLPSLFHALQLYRGVFVPGTTVPSILDMRERLRRKFVRATLELCQFHERAGDAQAAIDLYQEALRSEVQAEPLHRGLIACLARARRTAEAAQAYERCCTLL
jgi:LuxR family maltose regulon positive regulatory protein